MCAVRARGRRAPCRNGNGQWQRDQAQGGCGQQCARPAEALDRPVGSRTEHELPDRPARADQAKDFGQAGADRAGRPRLTSPTSTPSPPTALPATALAVNAEQITQGSWREYGGATRWRAPAPRRRQGSRGSRRSGRRARPPRAGRVGRAQLADSAMARLSRGNSAMPACGAEPRAAWPWPSASWVPRVTQGHEWSQRPPGSGARRGRSCREVMAAPLLRLEGVRRSVENAGIAGDAASRRHVAALYLPPTQLDRTAGQDNGLGK